MGYFSEMAIELSDSLLSDSMDNWQKEQAKDENALDFDERNYTDGAWWAEQDAEMQAEELAHIEAQAEIQEMIHNGYGE